ncbi:MAG: hypothetical protein WC517_04925 [Patescibacteria group bacterium]
MKKSSAASILHFIISLLMISIIIVSAVSCSPATTDPINTISSSLSQSSVKANSSPAMSETPAPANTPSIEQWNAATTIVLKDAGLESINMDNFYWSPDAKFIIFMGYIKNKDNKFIMNVYLLRVSDKKLIKLIDGTIDNMTDYIVKPQWSGDGSLAVINFCSITRKKYFIYLYNTKQETLELIPVNGFFPSISPDKSKMVYFDKNYGLSLFEFSNRTGTVISGKIKGVYPIWFSDNKRILFSRKTGKNPLGLEETEIYDICIMDTRKPEGIRSLGFEGLPCELAWMVRNELAWTKTRHEDGDYFGVFDIASLKMIDLGKKNEKTYQMLKGELYYIQLDEIVSGGQYGYQLLDHNRKVIGAFAVGENNYNVRPFYALSLLPDKRLFYLQADTGNNKASLAVSYLNENRFVPLSVIDGSYIPIISEDGAGIAFISKEGDRLILIDPSKI